MLEQTQELMKRNTLSELVNAWKASVDEITLAYQTLMRAETRLKETFGAGRGYMPSFSLNSHGRGYPRYEDPTSLIKELKKDAWRCLIERMELRRVLSVKKATELDKQLESGEGLPDIEEVQILDMLRGTMESIDTFMEDAVKEVFDYLRPRHDTYKTNSQFEVGRKVVLTWSVEQGWGREKFRVCYYREKEIRAMDNVFHLLDGNGTVKTNRGPLCDAIIASPDGHGETEYFKFKCFKNRNLHLEFKRVDLVEKLNQVAGGMRLRAKPKEES